jgi:hypothetical protein
VHEIEVTVYGWKRIVLIDASTKIPLAGQVVPINAHEVLSLRALVTQARTNLAGYARLHKVVFDTGFLDGIDLGWLDQRGILFVVPARDTMAVTVDAQAQAAASEGITVGRRGHTARHGHGKTAWTGRLETEDDDRSLIENGCIKESQPPGSVKHPPQKTARAVRVHAIFTVLLVALATAYRLRREQADTGSEPVGWQRWRRQLLEQTRGHVIVFAQGCYGVFHLAEYSPLVGVHIKDRPPGIGPRQQILAKYGLSPPGSAYI